MGSTLEEFFVSIGVKGQNVVLKNIDKVKKEANNLSKLKPMLDMGKGNIAKAMTSIKSMAGITGQILSAATNPEQEKIYKFEKDNTNKFNNGVKKFGNAAKDIATSASNFDPLNVVKAATTGIGESLSGISILGNTLGNLPKGISDVLNSMTDMASGALRMAKESAAGAYNLKTRNATTAYYEGREYNGKDFIGDKLNQSGMSRIENAQLVMEIASSFGRIQKPMMTVLNKLVENKDTAALGRVASGNWESTGTDKGWILQQIANQTAGLPPSIKQAIQSSLLENNSDLIQRKTKGQKSAQSINAGFVNRAEDQTEAMFQATKMKNDTFQKMDSNLNAMQIQLVDTGVKFAGAIVKATNALAALPETIRKVQSGIDSVMKYGPEPIRNLVPRLDK